MDISEQLRQVTETAIRAGATRYAIAKGAGVDYAALTRWLDDGSDIRFSTATKLAAHFGLELRPAGPKPAKGKKR